MFHTSQLDAGEALSLIARTTAHIPPGASLGRIFYVSPAGILTLDDASAEVTYGYDVDDDHTWRMVPVSASLYECTKWRDGREIGRYVIKSADDE